MKQQSLIISCMALALHVLLFLYRIQYARVTLLLFSATAFFLVNTFLNKATPTSVLPPGPLSWPLIGSLPELYRKKLRSKWILGLMDEYNTDIACVRVGSVHIIPVKCPKLAREFLIKQDANFSSRPTTMATEYISRGMFPLATAPVGDYWKKMRKMAATELFSAAKLRWLHDMRVEEADNLVRYIFNQCTTGGAGAIVNVRHVTWMYTGNVIRRFMFNKRYFGEGKKDGGPTADEDEHVEAIFKSLSYAFSFCVSDYMPSLRCLDLDGHEKIVKASTKIVDKYHNPIIDTRIAMWKDRKEDKKPEDFLDVFISLKDEDGRPLLSTQEIKGLIAELATAIVDNPSNAAEWALAEMINEPEILQKAMNEIDSVVGKERLVEETDISKLNYVKACAREAFRLHPIAIFNLPHVSTVDTTVGGYFIPKGSHVLVSRSGLGRNPKVWDEPLMFKPERHLIDSSDVELSEPDLRFISFSTGRRGCMAVPLGSAMTIMLLARLLQGFEWSVPHGGSKIDLSESRTDLALATPLHAHATPRLPPHVYPIN